MYGAGTGILGTLLKFDARFLKFHMMIAYYNMIISTLFLGEKTENRRKNPNPNFLLERCSVSVKFPVEQRSV